MTQSIFNFQASHPSWHHCLKSALQQMDPLYLEKLNTTKDWLPGPEKIFNAFSIPVSTINYLLIGESPYPRTSSANGYAFWDASVKELWSTQGMNKKVNRATSLRNFIKMLLLAEGLLKPPHFTQLDITKIDKTPLVQSNAELFTHLLNQGFLLLNATLVLHPRAIKNTQTKKDAEAWRPFIQEVINFISKERPKVKFLLFGRIAQDLDTLLPHNSVNKLCAEHPYNYSFINNKSVLDFFKPLHLLCKDD